MKEIEMEKERVAIYEEIGSKHKLSPLIELIKPTPLLDRKRADFGAKWNVEERKEVPDTKVDNGQSHLRESDRLQPVHVVMLFKPLGCSMSNTNQKSFPVDECCNRINLNPKKRCEDCKLSINKQETA